MEASVVVSDVSKSFGKKLVLNNINLNINKGQIYGLIGPSGSGKTTLVKMIVGMEAPDKGTIKVLNKSVPNLKLLQNIGYMAQSDALYTELTAQENLKFYASLFKLNKRAMKNRISYVVNMVNLNNDLSKKVSTYSGGMKRRLSLAIALIQNPEILILDEPTVGIDPELRLNIWNELLRLKNEENKTIIVTTHVMDEAKKCDFLAMVRDGVILADGTPSELMEYYKANDLDEVFLKAGRKKI
ncbi:ABC transporter ATP-binding protein [Clostridium botulinum]|uniref:ABC transporter, ATP-binding protein n=1 Tax=Clostridium botulinum (strain Langeland / NCTC 10281 / Type F) TaxID=441772 RepID=A7GB45_CLOBL|nr:ABC transporter ATP-binding protein [Clostridium botulinum]ABS42337.1 ABC transporter, ATP-binding protein [Clostridium botulinum F str. Langeland]ADF98468.1 ABC transporter, ATP-binding protein [Clostridium botulinum F str. 230613]KKM40243.1 glycosyl transferase family 2 [Clostridium botulinum]MBY6793470.1 ABC transporter ATP-binding protein [Clostridium botulinum]MBY6938964.1 ABC transporter ATP-binding protein [Clostridium botulinum]